MARTTRTFIAVPLSESSTKKVARLQANLSNSGTGIRWVEPKTLHLTLAFLGDVPDTDLHAICNKVKEHVGLLRGFSLDIVGLGTFPEPSKPRVLWAGLQGDLDALKALHRAVIDGATDAGYRPEDERFEPHITLGRIRQGRGPSPVDLTGVVNRHRLWQAGSLDCAAVVTYSSSLTPDGPIYDVLGTARLRPPAKEPRPRPGKDIEPDGPGEST